MEPTERRRDVRAHASPVAHIVRIGAVERVDVLNASYRGLFLRSASPPPLAELLRIRIELPARRIDVNIVAVRLITDANGRTGVGVKFFALGGEEKRVWDDYITSLVSVRRMAA